MKFGINLLLWTDDPTNTDFYPLYERLAGMGYDGLELPIFDGDPDKFYQLGRDLKSMGLECTATSALNASQNIASADKTVRSTGIEALKRCIDCCDAADAKLLGGPLYAAIGEFSGAGPTEDELLYASESVDLAAKYADKNGISLTLEFLNRFEIYLLNTATDTSKFIERLSSKNISVHFDTFHAHIEEKDIAAALHANHHNIGHIHISENDRGTPGSGQVRWAEFFKAIVDIKYNGWLTLEAFGQGIPAVAAATKIWRPIFDTEEQLAFDGLSFVRKMYHSTLDSV